MTMFKLYPIIARKIPINPPNKIPKHLEQKNRSSPKNQIVRSFFRWQKQKPYFLLSRLMTIIGPISSSDSIENNFKRII